MDENGSAQTPFFNLMLKPAESLGEQGLVYPPDDDQLWCASSSPSRWALDLNQFDSQAISLPAVWGAQRGNAMNSSRFLELLPATRRYVPRTRVSTVPLFSQWLCSLS
mgnify:FL=1